MGLNLGKPAPVETPEDYVYEQSIPDTPMTRKFGHLRGAKVKTVSETVADFYTHVSGLLKHDYGTPRGMGGMYRDVAHRCRTKAKKQGQQRVFLTVFGSVHTLHIFLSFLNALRREA